MGQKNKQTLLSLFTHPSFISLSIHKVLFETINVLCEAETEVLRSALVSQTNVTVSKDGKTSPASP